MQIKPLLLFCLCLPGLPASAAIVTSTDTLPLADVDISGMQSVDRFDPSIGTLISVSWEIVGAIASILGISNDGTNPIDGSSFVSVDFDLSSSGISVPASPDFTVTASTGLVALGVGESALFPVTAQTTMSGTEPVGAAFIGPGTIDLSFLTTTSFGGRGFGGDISLSVATDAGLQFSITYEYDDRSAPWIAHVPLPASALLLLTGIGALGIASHRRR